jgi:hypothetical protein
LGFGVVQRSEWVKAVDQQGSESNTITITQRRWLLFNERLKRTELVLRANDQDQILWLDHLNRTYESRTGHRNFQYWEEDDAQCSRAASRDALTGRLSDAEIAGTHVVGWSGHDAGGFDVEVYFAPSIACQTFREQMIKRGLFGYVTEKYLREVDSYVLGPPDPSLFRRPTDYRLVQSVVAGR